MLDRLDIDTDKPSEEEIARKFGFEDAYHEGRVSWWQNTKHRVWSIFDEPYSSTPAKVATHSQHFTFLGTLKIYTMLLSDSSRDNKP